MQEVNCIGQNSEFVPMQFLQIGQDRLSPDPSCSSLEKSGYISDSVCYRKDSYSVCVKFKPPDADVGGFVVDL
jgi:hypothetical protein